MPDHPTYQYQPEHNETAATKYVSESLEDTAKRVQNAARARLAALGLNPGEPMKPGKREDHV